MLRRGTSLARFKNAGRLVSYGAVALPQVPHVRPQSEQTRGVSSSTAMPEVKRSLPEHIPTHIPNIPISAPSIPMSIPAPMPITPPSSLFSTSPTSAVSLNASVFPSRVLIHTPVVRLPQQQARFMSFWSRVTGKEEDKAAHSPPPSVDATTTPPPPLDPEVKFEPKIIEDTPSVNLAEATKDLNVVYTESDEVIRKKRKRPTSTAAMGFDDLAQKILDHIEGPRIENPSLARFHVLVSKVDTVDQWDTMAYILKRLQTRMLECTSHTVGRLVSTACRVGAEKELVNILSDADTYRLFPAVGSLNKLIFSLLQKGETKHALYVYDRVFRKRFVKPNAETYENLLRGLTFHHEMQDAYSVAQVAFENGMINTRRGWAFMFMTSIGTEKVDTSDKFWSELSPSFKAWPSIRCAYVGCQLLKPNESNEQVIEVASETFKDGLQDSTKTEMSNVLVGVLSRSIPNIEDKEVRSDGHSRLLSNAVTLIRQEGAVEPELEEKIAAWQ